MLLSIRRATRQILPGGTTTTRSATATPIPIPSPTRAASRRHASGRHQQQSPGPAGHAGPPAPPHGSQPRDAAAPGRLLLPGRLAPLPPPPSPLPPPGSSDPPSRDGPTPAPAARARVRAPRGQRRGRDGVDGAAPPDPDPPALGSTPVRRCS
ncbi:hypothetical protein ZWY2020_015426 [Hordeum vulgare]|nr:hypothetical protein ZWY2020_015426 [Hordeum vulgare]